MTPSRAATQATGAAGASEGVGESAGAAAVKKPMITARGGAPEPFVVELANFSGPFDLLLSLIAKHRLDVTEVALSQVTDEFVAHLRRLGDRFDLGQATEFLVIAATLLDLKAARLLPGALSEDEAEDLALLEARDLLFARLLQYRAYKEASALFAGLMALEARHVPRAVALESRYADALPEVQIGIGPSELAALAARLREPPLPPLVATDHVHLPRVSVREHMIAIIGLLRELGTAEFRTLCAGCRQTIEVVARFLALLELFREGRVSFDQEVPLGELTVRWIATDDVAADLYAVGRGLYGDDASYGDDDPHPDSDDDAHREAS
ncbi:segregation/condensation protein A [Frankia sp. AgPm24]|uniref:segregation and condensation protein A n=1 Tax=Frankia sp. AgPm24 TaxID=631128 RepID=UPI00200D6B5F|nr:ScpA family protein [Frankia sp. AgPm24]MCK9924483.1 segregation/condensation protein A [Frankia sp. AgPm24]